MIYLTGAYGRTYDNIQDLKDDWESGKDFMVYNGPYCSNRDTKFLLDQYNPVIICDLLILKGENEYGIL